MPDHYRYRAICKAWRDRLDVGVVKHVDIVIWPPQPSIDEAKFAIRTRNLFNDKSRMLCHEPKPSSFWDFEGKKGEESEWLDLLAHVEVVDILVVDSWLDDANWEVVDGPADDSLKESCPPLTPSSMTVALRGLLNLLSHVPTIRLQGNVDAEGFSSPLASTRQTVPTLQGYGPLGRVYFYPILNSNFICGSRTRAHGDSPMFLNFCMGEEDQLDSDDSSEEAWWDDSDSDDEGRPLRLNFPDYTERLPVLADFLCERGPAWTPRDGHPHVTLIFHDPLPRDARGEPAEYFKMFFLGCDNRQAWNVWVVGLDCFLAVRSGKDWDKLLLKTQSHWRSQIENPPSVKFLTHHEYRCAIKDPWAMRLHMAP